MQMLTKHYPLFNDTNLRPLGIKNASQFDRFCADLFRITLGKGVMTEYIPDDKVLFFIYDRQKERVVSNGYALNSEKRKKIVMDKVRSTLMDIYENGQFNYLYIVDLVIYEDEQFTFTREDEIELTAYMDKWAKTNNTYPVFAVGHADEDGAYLHWHIILTGEMSYVRGKRLINLKNRGG